MRIALTGGTGFIGSHQAVTLISAGHDVVIVDDGSNSDACKVGDRIGRIAGICPPIEVFDVRDTTRLTDVLRAFGAEAVIHLAGSKHVRESVERPSHYFRNNIDGLASVVEAAGAVGAFRLVFSSSGSVYGHADRCPIPESAAHRPTNPYALTKSVGEQMLRDVTHSDPRWSITALRYFNPAGGHPSGLLGDDPVGAAANLLPRVLQVALGMQSEVEILGDDWATNDGTAERDYVHVLDVADAHVRALTQRAACGFEAFNIGRGVGVSVLELVEMCRRITGHPIPTRVVQRRPGDVATLVADTTSARSTLGIDCARDLEHICTDAWRSALCARSGVAV
ncbi:MAG: UDP-glucose 4-epimerase GalE [Acidimicrobiales bacterium]